MRELPEELEFCLPGKVGEETPLSGEPEWLYQQLVCWCLVQRFWYYCCSNAQVSDTEYDYYEAAVKEMEQEFGFSNEYSPTRRPGSDRPFDYPGSIHNFFAPAVLGMSGWQYRVKYRTQRFTSANGQSTNGIPDMGVGDIPGCTCAYCQEYRRLHETIPVDVDRQAIAETLQ